MGMGMLMWGIWGMVCWIHLEIFTGVEETAFVGFVVGVATTILIDEAWNMAESALDGKTNEGGYTTRILCKTYDRTVEFVGDLFSENGENAETTKEKSKSNDYTPEEEAIIEEYREELKVLYKKIQKEKDPKNKASLQEKFNKIRKERNDKLDSLVTDGANSSEEDDKSDTSNGRCLHQTAKILTQENKAFQI